MTRDRIQHALDIIYEKVFNLGQADLYPGLVSGPYLQHNPLFPNGLNAIVGYIKQAGRIPCEVKRVAIDGDLAFVHVRYLDWGGKETAGVDIFRFDENGKVVEHWDVLQPVPASSNNANTNPGPIFVDKAGDTIYGVFNASTNQQNSQNPPFGTLLNVWDAVGPPPLTRATRALSRPRPGPSETTRSNPGRSPNTALSGAA